MARTAVARAMTRSFENGDLVFSVADDFDAPDIRRLLRENPLGGAFQITLERAENPLHDDFGLARSSAFIIARERASGEAVGLCERVTRDAWVDGAIRPLPYLGALRIAANHRRRIGVLRGGFAALRRLVERHDEAPFALTSITSDNLPARRLLTAGLPGLPLYHPVGDFSTFCMRPKRQRTAPEIFSGRPEDLAELASFLRVANANFQFAQVWSEDSLRSLAAWGLPPENFLLARRGGEIAGCLAVWDQTRYRQIVVRRYPTILSRMRPLANFFGPLAGMPHLPPTGAPLRQSTFSHLAVANDDPELFLALVAAGLDLAHRLDFLAAALGFASARAWREILLRRHRALEYRTSLFLAHWPEAAETVKSLQVGLPHPDLGLL